MQRVKSIIKSPYSIVILLLLILTFLFISDLVGDDVYSVKSVIDGDTIILEDISSTSVRYLGVDSPEVKSLDAPGDPLSDEARRINKNLVDGKRIRLEFDKERFDPYGRTLAYVFVDDIFVNEQILRSGLAKALIIQPNDKYAERLLKAEKEAKDGRRGIWGDISRLEPPEGNRNFIVKPSSASRYIDQRVVVRGKITRYRKSDKVLVLKMEDVLDIVLFPDSLSNFSFFNIIPEEYYVGKPVEVIGKIRMYRGRPNIIISHPISIRALM
ncbi:MAG: thermonuclease family protein [Deltaproteobacteria bacterium]|nr:thermonuclease family protein [Deltaproteobacteria bacterium]